MIPSVFSVCTEGINLAWFVDERVGGGEKSHFHHDHVCSVGPLDSGAHVVPKTQLIRSCGHTVHAFNVMATYCKVKLYFLISICKDNHLKSSKM